MSTTTVLTGHTRFANQRETPERGDENPTAVLTGPSPTPDPRSITRGKSDAARTPPLSSLPGHPRTSPATAVVGQQRRRKHHRRPRWTHAVCEREGNHTTRRREYHRRLRWTPGVCRPKENPTTRRRDYHRRPRWIHAISEPKGNTRRGGYTTHATCERQGNPTTRRQDALCRPQCGPPLLCAELNERGPKGDVANRGRIPTAAGTTPPPYNSPSPTNHPYPAQTTNAKGQHHTDEHDR